MNSQVLLTEYVLTDMMDSYSNNLAGTRHSNAEQHDWAVKTAEFLTLLTEEDAAVYLVTQFDAMRGTHGLSMWSSAAMRFLGSFHMDLVMNRHRHEDRATEEAEMEKYRREDEREEEAAKNC